MMRANDNGQAPIDAWEEFIASEERRYDAPKKWHPAASLAFIVFIGAGLWGMIIGGCSIVVGVWRMHHGG